MENEPKNDARIASHSHIDDTERDVKSECQTVDESSDFLRRPQKVPYTFLFLPSSSSQKSARNIIKDVEDISMPGFAEFRKYKRANETRKITPYVPEEVPKRNQDSEKANDVEIIEIKDAEKFLRERIEPIPVTSLRSILNVIQQNPDIGFMTMKRDHMDLVHDYKPYDYTICHFNDVDKSDYVSISPNGLVEFYKDDADFMPLERLELEYELYNKLKEIPFFQTYRQWKSFMVWLSKIRRRKFMMAKDKLEVFFSEKYKNVASN